MRVHVHTKFCFLCVLTFLFHQCSHCHGEEEHHHDHAHDHTHDDRQISQAPYLGATPSQGSKSSPPGDGTLEEEQRFYIQQLFNRYGQKDRLDFQGFERLLNSLGLGELKVVGLEHEDLGHDHVAHLDVLEVQEGLHSHLPTHEGGHGHGHTHKKAESRPDHTHTEQRPTQGSRQVPASARPPPSGTGPRRGHDHKHENDYNHDHDHENSPGHEGEHNHEREETKVQKGEHKHSHAHEHEHEHEENDHRHHHEHHGHHEHDHDHEHENDHDHRKPPHQTQSLDDPPIRQEQPPSTQLEPSQAPQEQQPIETTAAGVPSSLVSSGSEVSAVPTVPAADSRPKRPGRKPARGGKVRERGRNKTAVPVSSPPPTVEHKLKHDHDHDNNHEQTHEHEHSHDHDHDHDHHKKKREAPAAPGGPVKPTVAAHAVEQSRLKHDHDHDHDSNNEQNHNHDHDHDHDSSHSHKRKREAPAAPGGPVKPTVAAHAVEQRRLRHDHDHDHDSNHEQNHNHDHDHDHDSSHSHKRKREALAAPGEPVKPTTAAAHAVGQRRLKHDHDHDRDNNHEQNHNHDRDHDHDHSSHSRKKKREAPSGPVKPSVPALQGHPDGMFHQHEQCLNLTQLLSYYGLSPDSLISPEQFTFLCPALLYQIDMRVCIHHYHQMEVEEAALEHVNPVYVWVWGFVSITIISLLSLLGVILVPILNQSCFKYLLTFLVALAVGTLSGDALLHLLPHSQGQHDHSNPGAPREQSMLVEFDGVWKGLTALSGIYLLFIIEHCIGMFKHYKDQGGRLCGRKRRGDEAKIGRKLSDHKLNRRSDAEWLNLKPLTEGPDGTVVSSCDNGHNDTQLSELQPPDSPTNKTPLAPADTDHHHGHEHGHASSPVKENGRHAKKHGHHHGHGHSHAANCHSDQEMKDAGIASIAWMVIMGDGMHNFSDGLAIGAAFSANTTGGISTSVAVFCHELPHELGDFAVLIKAGMSVKQAIVYNLLSALMAYIGMLIGIAVGQNTHNVTNWIFAVTAGMFLYVALVDMLPEMLHGDSEEHKRCHMGHFVLQNMGLLTGFAIMLLIAIFEDQIVLDFGF